MPRHGWGSFTFGTPEMKLKIQILLTDAALFTALWLEDLVNWLVKLVEERSNELNKQARGKAHE
jgi:hypothetical protein